MSSLKSNWTCSSQGPKVTLAAPAQNQKNDTSLLCLRCCTEVVEERRSPGRQGAGGGGRMQWWMSGAASDWCLERGCMGKRHGWDQQVWSEEWEVRGGSPWGKYIFHPSLMLISIGVSQSPVATGHSVVPEAVGGVVDTEVQSHAVTLGSQHDILK